MDSVSTIPMQGGRQHPMIPVPEAIWLVLRETAKRLGSTNSSQEIVHVEQSLHRIIARDIHMPEPGYPPFSASILDGYAIRREEVVQNPEGNLTIIGRVHAGEATNVHGTDAATMSDSKAAIYVTTGAKIPEGGFDCVVGIENVVLSDSESGTNIRVKNLPNKSWIRAPGSDIPAGTLIAKAGYPVTPVELGLLLQSGYTKVPVRRKIHVGIVSSGNELVDNDPSWLADRNGKIPDVNGPMILGLLGSLPSIQARHFGVVRDDSVAELTEALRNAANDCDVLITTGGISMGDADLIEDVMVNSLGGELHFGRLHMKPGKPSTFITLPDDTLVFCLPGNPVSAYVCTHLLVIPSLDLLCRGSEFRQIEDIVENASVFAEQSFALKQDLPLDFERPEYHRIQMQSLVSTGVQQSSRLMSCQNCAGLVVLPQATNQKQIAAKGEVHVMLMIHDKMRIRVRDSAHMMRPPADGNIVRVKVLHMETEDERFADILKRGFHSTAKHQRGHHFELIGHRCFKQNDLSTFTLHKDDQSTSKQDLTLIIGPSSLRSYSLLATRLRSICTKRADAMALQVVQHGGDSLVRDCVIGFKDQSCLIIYLSQSAMNDGLRSIQGLLSHAIQTSKGM